MLRRRRQEATIIISDERTLKQADNTTIPSQELTPQQPAMAMSVLPWPNGPRHSMGDQGGQAGGAP